MHFKSIAKALFFMIKEKKVQDFVKEKKITLHLDVEKKVYILSAEVFFDQQYIPSSIKDFVHSHKIVHHFKTYLETSLEEKKVFLMQDIPLNYKKNSYRELYLDFSLLAKSYVASLQDEAQKDLLFQE